MQFVYEYYEILIWFFHIERLKSQCLTKYSELVNTILITNLCQRIGNVY